MTNLNTQQTEALEFFEDNYQAVQAYGLHILGGREERQLYRQGRDLLDKVCQVKKTRNPYLKAEAELLVQLYIQGVERQDYVKTFNGLMTHNHSDDSIEQIFCQLRAADNTNPQCTGWVIKSLFSEIASDMAPGRFA